MALPFNPIIEKELIQCQSKRVVRRHVKHIVKRGMVGQPNLTEQFVLALEDLPCLRVL